MTTIVDRRKSGKNKSAENRKRFIDRYKEQIRDQVDSIADKRKIKDVAKEGKVKVKDISEPWFQHGKGGKQWKISPGNKQYQTGDKIKKPKKNSGGPGGAGNSGEGEDDFVFSLSKAEFLSLYFGDLELPNFIKEALAKTTKFKYKRAGFTPVGPYSRLDLKKTFEQSLARRVANKRNNKKSRFLDDTDLRYRLYTKQPEPIKKAVMFCLMDVSASVGERQKYLSKKFYLFLYLFLTTKYETVDIRFIRYHTYPKEVDEETFFYGTDTGGTKVADALQYMKDIILQEYDLTSVNIFCCHSSDGDYITYEHEEDSILNLMTQLTNICQYYIYIQAIDIDYSWKDELGGLYKLFKYHLDSDKFAQRILKEETEVYSVFRDFFELSL